MFHYTEDQRYLSLERLLPIIAIFTKNLLMKKFLLLFLAISSLLVACNNDDDALSLNPDNPNPIVDATVQEFYVESHEPVVFLAVRRRRSG